MKRILILILSTLVVFALAACGGEKMDDATKEKYISKAEEVVELLNEGKYEEVHTSFTAQMQTGLPVEAMSQLTPIIEQSGQYEKIDKSSVEEKDGYYVVVLVGKYSEQNRVFTISFDKNDQIAGLYIK